MPRYFDYLIEGFWSGRAGRNVHLGYWDAPPPLTAPCDRREFEAAQARLTDVLIGLAELRGGLSVLDVGCGFGGTLEALARWPDMRLTGVNVDRRQLDICRALSGDGATLSLVMADACALPFRPSIFDRVFCVEAMFHFRSREVFLREAAKLLRNDGRLVISDILLRRPGEGSTLSTATIENALRDEYGPWPSLWLDADEILALARQAGLEPERIIDATRQTLPTYRVTAPQDHDGLAPRTSAGSVLRWLHASGHLSYMCLSFVKS
ncbi:MAG TPA: methyltransferase domain-containing protein [Steroidobacteraceae bacterium]